MSENETFYWDIDIPGLSEMGAKGIASILSKSGAVDQLILVDPRLSMTLRLDEVTVSEILQALQSSEAGNNSAVVQGVVEDMEDWLASRGEP